jgi:hypothetical protein
MITLDTYVGLWPDRIHLRDVVDAALGDVMETAVARQLCRRRARPLTPAHVLVGAPEVRPIIDS